MHDSDAAAAAAATAAEAEAQAHMQAALAQLQAFADSSAAHAPPPAAGLVLGSSAGAGAVPAGSTGSYAGAAALHHQQHPNQPYKFEQQPMPALQQKAGMWAGYEQQQQAFGMAAGPHLPAAAGAGQWQEAAGHGGQGGILPGMPMHTPGASQSYQQL
ncbi:hypothetical protein COO60DRAFT_1506418 [Scenedesmus sp. NREL 46B-D3]|nr:hypothetical protein COO60DRAFT_1506418 [Scenedesmus sp. NREL 46B-D3]